MQLVEVKRSEYISDTKKSDNYALDNLEKGRNRFWRRTHSKVSRSTAEYNRIDMNKLFTEGTLDVNIIVHGETSDYTVRIVFNNVMDSLHQEMNRYNDQFSRRVILKALVNSLNREDLQTRCTCPDAKYRQNYFLSQKDAIAGEKEIIPSKETNPNDTKGTGCKHVQVVLTNNSWLQPISNVIYNYVNYMEKHYEDMYARIIYPAIYQQQYQEPTQPGLFDTDELQTTSDDIDTSNKWAREKTRFQKGNPYRFRPDDVEDDEIEGLRSFDFDSVDDEDEEDVVLNPENVEPEEEDTYI